MVAAKRHMSRSSLPSLSSILSPEVPSTATPVIDADDALERTG